RRRAAAGQGHRRGRRQPERHRYRRAWRHHFRYRAGHLLRAAVLRGDQAHLQGQAGRCHAGGGNRGGPLMNRQHILVLAFATLGLGACATLAPDYQRPAAPVPAAWATAAGADDTAAAADIAWREFFADERLRRVVELALEHNRDLRVAALNIELARAQYRIQRADQFPSLGLTASQNGQRVPGDLNSTGESM